MHHYRINGDPVSLLSDHIQPNNIITYESPKGNPPSYNDFTLGLKYYHAIATIYSSISIGSPTTIGIPDINYASFLSTVINATGTAIDGTKKFTSTILTDIFGNPNPYYFDPPDASGYVFDGGSGPLFHSVALPIRNDNELYTLFILDNGEWVLYGNLVGVDWHIFSVPLKTFAIGNWPDYGPTILGAIFGLKFSSSGTFDGTVSPFEAASPYSRPVANAGSDQVVRIGDVVGLQGSGIDHVRGPDPLTYQWSQASGPSVEIENSGFSSASFIAGILGSYTFSLAVYDGETWSELDDVMVTVVNAATNPACGNGQIEDGEQCDDGNLIPGDGCSATCTTECVATKEVCDGIDNDCDGQIDEGYVCNPPGDLNLDGIVDRTDVAILTSYLNKPLSECPECDFDGNKKITVLDARKLATMCTYPNCATN